MVADLLMAPNLLVSKVRILLSSGASLRKANTTNVLSMKNLTLGILTLVLLDNGSPKSPLAPDSPIMALFLFLKRILAAIQLLTLALLTFLCLLLENENCINSISK